MQFVIVVVNLEAVCTNGRRLLNRANYPLIV